MPFLPESRVRDEVGAGDDEEECCERQAEAVWEMEEVWREQHAGIHGHPAEVTAGGSMASGLRSAD